MVGFWRGNSDSQTEREREDDIEIAAAMLGFELIIVKLLACCTIYMFRKYNKSSVSFL